MVTVLKLGGSVITDKNTPETVDTRALVAAADALMSVSEPLVIVHGGGSFGHVHAAEHGISTTVGTTNWDGIYAVHAAMKRLNTAVLDVLHDRSIPAVPVHPLSVAERDRDGTLSLPVSSIDRLLKEGAVPVLHGDVIAHEEHGATVLSGDEVVTHVATGLSADRIGICSTVPGVLDDEDNVIEQIHSYDDVEAYLGGSESTDVSGGMAGKVKTLLSLGAPATIFGPEQLQPFLDGEAVGTYIDGSQ
ncbi:isopentenyl phosphate kinase family protein [Halorubraceae archaeon YAN]|nr:isopentenyl phosphate kinase family protein [Halorubraceae archaeon YAN]